MIRIVLHSLAFSLCIVGFVSGTIAIKKPVDYELLELAKIFIASSMSLSLLLISYHNKDDN